MNSNSKLRRIGVIPCGEHSSVVYQELLSQHEQITRSCCLKFQLDESHTEEMVQDTFVIAMKSLPHYRGASKLSSWLWSIAQRQVINHFRRNSRRKTNKAYQTLALRVSPSHSPFDALQKHELIQHLNNQIEALPTTWQRVLQLYYWEQVNTDDIAARLKISPSGVRVILYRSRNRLRNKLWPLAG